MYRLSLESFKKNFLYTALDEASFLSAYQRQKDMIDPDFVLLAEKGEDLLGCVFAVPDLLALKEGRKAALIVKTLATSPNFRTAGLGTVLVDKVQRSALAKGYESAIHALQFESNSSRKISRRFHAEVFREYSLMVFSKL